MTENAEDSLAPAASSTIPAERRRPHSSRSVGFTLPLPCSPSSSFPVYRARFKALFANAEPKVLIAFWFFGLINNVLYVIILSSALDLVGPSLPKSLVLLFDVVPSFLTKLWLPYVVHMVPYTFRIPILVALSFAGMQFVANAPNLWWRMFGVIFASTSAGAGELSFLGLTHFYDDFAIAAWGSGTGAAGLVGAGLYTMATTWLRLSIRGSLFGFSFLPLVMLGAFFFVLPREPLAYKSLEGEEVFSEIEYDRVSDREIRRSDSPVNLRPGSHHSFTTIQGALQSFRRNLNRSKKLFVPYMLPLLLVYIGEYTINQGVSPTLLFYLPDTPFERYRDFYPTYNTIYQVGVFVSRSSSPFIRIHHLYPPSLLQLVNLVILLLHALYPYIPSIYIVFVIIFWEGLLGGAVYVNTFAEITDNVPVMDREFSLGATTVSDSAGTCIAGFLGLLLEPWLCGWQVKRGRDYCTMT